MNKCNCGSRLDAKYKCQECLRIGCANCTAVVSSDGCRYCRGECMADGTYFVISHIMRLSDRRQVLYTVVPAGDMLNPDTMITVEHNPEDGTEPVALRVLEDPANLENWSDEMFDAVLAPVCAEINE